MKRSQIAKKYKWDLSAFAKDEEDFLLRTENLKKYIPIFASYEGKLSDDKLLLELLDKTSEYSKEASLLLNYASRKVDEDLSNSKANENFSRLVKIDSDISIALSYLTPEVCKFSTSKLKQLQNNKQFFAHKLFFKDILRQKQHILPKEQEKLISGMGEFLGGFSSDFDNFVDADMKLNDVLDSKGKKHKFTHSLYGLYLRSNDRTLRENAFKEENGAFGRYINFIANNYLSDVKADCYFAKVRGYKSALSRAIFEEEASEQVYDTLIKNVHKNLPLLYKFFAKKKKLLGLDKMYIYDQYAQVGKRGNKKYTYDEAIELVKQATKPLGRQYTSLIQKAKDEHWVDVMPNDGKAGGAYESSAYGAHPVVLTNFTGDFNSVSTLAHELGHAMHSYFSERTQIFEEAEYVLFVAEVASTVNELLLKMSQLKSSKTRLDRLCILDGIFMDVKSTIFRQTMFAEFEEWVHSEYEHSVPLSKDKLNKKYYELNKLYFGKGVALCKETQFEWARVPHFYRSFYVYKYATGLISALNIVSRILSGQEGAVEKYLNFLSAGCTKDPISLLQDAGCDLTKQETFDDVFKFLNKLLEEYE